MADPPPSPPASPPQAPNQQYVVYAQPPPPSKKSRAALGAVIVIVIVLLVILVGLYAGGFLTPASNGGSGSSAKVDVTAINLVSSANPCGVNGNSFTGYTTPAGGSEQDTLTITNNGLLFSCTISSVSATTSGFSISGANVPLTIPAGGTQALSFTIGSPNSAYTGVLTLDIE